MNRFAEILVTIRHEVLQRIGAAGVIAMAITALALLTMLTLAPMLAKEAVDYGARAKIALSDIQQLAHGAISSPKASDQLAGFSGRFGAIDQNATDLRRLTEQAEKVNLRIVKGEYRISSEPNAAFISYEVILPVKAHYDTIRRFIVGVLAELPHASLAELRLERPAANDTVLDARLHFTLVYKGA